MKKTVSTFQAMKAEGRKISMLTCYDYSTARLIDEAGVDAVLVGDSLGNVILGYPDTLAVTMDDMIHHGAAVVRGVRDALVVVDMPFMSYQVSVKQAVKNAGRLVKKTGCAAVKLEGGENVADRVRAIVDAGIPVVGHIGLTPQSVNALGGYKVQGRDEKAAVKLMHDARALEKAGAFAIVLECVPAPLAAFISSHVCVPTIGIGAGAGCDGQVLVYQDMLGLYSDMKPKFVRRFAELGEGMRQAFAAYDKAVKDGTFPNESESFKCDAAVLERLY
ncbi:MAG: 3-methyl-2-oxobutanoate hydroxymethyltransferase [Duodenibacillus sp.]|nr:3-methyl-2-oxobutanoate hydroxymethyltransferase [Duodenibacillus sp.]